MYHATISYDDFAGMPEGTRCECTTQHEGPNPVAHNVGGCPNYAVCMVTVRPAHPMHVPGPVYTWESDPPHVPIPAEIQVPMCEPCAQYHLTPKKHGPGWVR